MVNFWDSSAWSTLFVISTLLISLLLGNAVKKALPFLKNSLMPTSVISGLLLIGIAAIYKAITGGVMFDSAFFGGRGTTTLEIITYHSLALGFIASSLKHTKAKIDKKRSIEIVNTGVTTVASYLIQGIFGMAITFIAALIITGFPGYSGILLPFGYGQGTGQAMNYGGIYESQHGFDGGRSFGLTIAALGFLSASIGGVIHLNIARHRGKLTVRGDKNRLNSETIEALDEIPMQESMDKMTVQISLIALTYALTYAFMSFVGSLVGDGLKATIYGFNFLIGVLMATLVKGLMNLGRKTKIIKKEYTNNFLLTRASNLFFDVMVVAGIAAIRLDILERYWGIMIILGAVGLVVTYLYNRIIAKTLFKDYHNEQFLAMYGMLTGTASTGIILLREVDGDFETPAADNLVYQNFPAIALGFPMMIVATMAPTSPYLVLGILIGYFIALNIFLFRSVIFKKRKKK